MSIRAIEWAYGQEISGAATKFVLVALADFADEEGTCFPGQELLAARTGQSMESVRRHLKWLEEYGFITRIRRFDKRGHRTSDRYRIEFDRATTGQLDHRSDCPPVNMTTGQTGSSLPVNLSIPTGQSDRVTVRGTIREPSDIRSASKRLPQTPLRFDEFWELYPRKVSKEAAIKAYERAAKKVGEEVIIEGVRRFADDPNRPTNKRYIPHPPKWLNDGRWDDEPYPPQTDQYGRTTTQPLADRLPMIGGM